MSRVHNIEVYGIEVDKQTRCGHYHSAIDIIAIKFPCCGVYCPCYECHQEISDHPATKWSKNQTNEKAILCGACGHQLTIQEYTGSNFVCPSCEANFNPGCQHHYHLYFELE